ncbi:MAG: FAD/NAD(P)-binding protein [Nitrospirae bacterium]|nr:FAD/NAD(P)-binding protein [Nitrospirota bacterium]
MKSELDPKIGVIGAGASGTALLYELFRQFKHDLPQVVLIDGGSQWGRGTVYLEDMDCALVNRQAKHMSLLFDDQPDFLRWIEQNPKEISQAVEQQYFTRATFGKYVEQRLNAIENLWVDSGGVFKNINEFVERVEETGNTVQISLPSQKLEVDYLVLCTGHGPQRPFTRFSGEMLNPYPLRELCTAVRGVSHVAVVGTGLTAIDCVLALLESNTSLRVSMFSRSGIIPDIRAEFEEDLPLTQPERTDHTGATLKELELKFIAELAAYNVSLTDLSGYVTKLRRGASNLFDPVPAIESHRRIQNLSISIANRDLPVYWHGFSDQDRMLFYDRYYRFLQAVTAPIPLSVAHKLRNAMSTGQLEVRNGTVERRGGAFRISSAAKKERYEVIIDATGRLTNAGQVDFEKMLITSGAALEELYGGICVDRRSGRIKRPDSKVSRVYGIGYVTRGSLLYSSSLYQATRNIKTAVANIKASVNGQE